MDEWPEGVFHIAPRVAEPRDSPYTCRVDAEGWLTSELAAFSCAACGQPYGEAQVRLIAQREELYFVDLSCPHCGSQAVAIVTIQIDGEPGTSEAPGDSLVDGPQDGTVDPPRAITVDDVIDIHALLRDYEGDLHQLVDRLGRRPS
jgi:hypothetical protein